MFVERYLDILKILFVSLLFILTGYWLYLYERAHVYSIIDTCFQNAISDDFNMRWKEISLPVYAMVSTDSTKDSITIEDSQGKRVVQNQHEASTQEKIYIGVLQSILKQENPINVNTLDSLFSKELYEKGLFASTSVCYTDNSSEEIYKSNADSSFYETAYLSPQIETGAEREIVLQAFVQVTWWSIVRSRASGFWVWGIIGFTFIITVFALLYRKSKQIVSINGAELLKHGPADIQITDTLVLDTHKHILRYEKQEIMLTEQTVALLKLFLAHEDYFVSYEDIERFLWGNLHKANDCRNQAIKRLRELLAPVPSLQIENMRTRGYRLIISTNTLPHPALLSD